MQVRVEHLQNAVLAGGVAVGAVADLLLGPHLALALGLLAGAAAVAGLQFTPAWIARVLRAHDRHRQQGEHRSVTVPPWLAGWMVGWLVVATLTAASCGAHALHGVPGLLGGLASAALAATVTPEQYGQDWEALFPAVAAGRSPGQQAAAQLAALLLTLGLALAGGLLTGLLMRVAGRLERGPGGPLLPAGTRYQVPHTDIAALAYT